jgi:hypothetical protein
VASGSAPVNPDEADDEAAGGAGLAAGSGVAVIGSGSAAAGTGARLAINLGGAVVELEEAAPVVPPERA